MVRHHLTEWADRIPDNQWQVYREVIDEALGRGIHFALGGAFAMAVYTGSWRNTKDIDLYVLPQERNRMVDVLTTCGLSDYFETKPYDRWWIHRGTRDETIVDVIWAMANHRQMIDDLWMSGPRIDVRGRMLKVLPAEAMLWDKLYIMQRDRCDWPDLFNLLYSIGPEANWEELLCRIGDDLPLITGVLSIFRWISPGRAGAMPRWIWERAGLPPPPPVPLTEIDWRRASLLDTRPWFGPSRGENPRAA